VAITVGVFVCIQCQFHMLHFFFLFDLTLTLFYYLILAPNCVLFLLTDGLFQRMSLFFRRNLVESHSRKNLRKIEDK